MAVAIRAKQLFVCSPILPNERFLLRHRFNVNVTARYMSSSEFKKKEKKKRKEVEVGRAATEAVVDKEKRRTRSSREYELARNGESPSSHVPVMLGEIVDVYSSVRLRSFVDCTLGSAGHSCAIIENHPELKHFIGMDVDPVAHKLANVRLHLLLHPSQKSSIVMKNFKCIKSVIAEADSSILETGVDGILMDLGMSSMQVNNPERGFSVLQEGPLDMRMDPKATLKAEDIVNSWPESELGRVLRDYSEESSWSLLQRKIIKARLNGGLHSTGELVNLIRSMSPGGKGGRQGWIKTATRVFQGLRIAVNDELKTLQQSLYASFEALAPGGRLSVITFHSLEDRIVKQTFLDILGFHREEKTDNGNLSFESQKLSKRDALEEEEDNSIGNDLKEKEEWIKQTVCGTNGVILTKRPITPSEEEERLNRRSRSAKLRVIQKL